MSSLTGQIFIVTKNRLTDRRRLVSMRLYSIANDGGFDLNRFIGFIATNCRRACCVSCVNRKILLRYYKK
ncbi:MAG: hypothetical protein LBP59_10045 [Planctomycetaceae bacterium]|nr:hypothetical protein [Planctomycetaceae bacterium]